MSDIAAILLITAAAGGLGGFLARAVPGGVRKKDLPDAPTEAGAVVSTLGGAAAAMFALLGTENFSGVIFFGPEKSLEVSYGAPEVVQAFGIGLVGLKWLINVQNSATLRAALATAAGKEPDAKTAAAAGGMSPRQVLDTARRAPG